MEGFKGYSKRELGMIALAGVSVLGVIAVPYLGPLFGVGLVLLGYAEHGFDGDAAEVGWQLIVVGAALTALSFLWMAFVLIS